MANLLYREITEQVIGAAFEVYKELGHGFLESVYQRAMVVELALRGIQAELEQPIKVYYKQQIVGKFEADLLVEDCLIVELKVAKEYRPLDEAQLLNELKAKRIKVGMLINFGASKVDFKRLAY